MMVFSVEELLARTVSNSNGVTLAKLAAVPAAVAAVVRMIAAPPLLGMFVRPQMTNPGVFVSKVVTTLVLARMLTAVSETFAGNESVTTMYNEPEGPLLVM